jgi:c(7)-type cytochrome triheme protein
MKSTTLFAAAALALAASPATAAESGKAVYDKLCFGCHTPGIAGAPRLGNAADWNPRLAAGGKARLYKSALQGTPKGMPAKGGNAQLTDAEVKATVDYMLSRLPKAEAAPAAKAEPKGKAEAVPKEAKAEAVPKEAKAEAVPKEAKAEAVPKEAKAEAPPAAAAPAPTAAPAPAQPVVLAAVSPGTTAGGDINAFNRLLKPLGKRNPPPPEDGIHDPANDGTHALQAPLTAFGALPKSSAGNRVNWVGALGNKGIKPRWDKQDTAAEPVVLDLNIVREVKGSMPDVVYPHKQHTEWLDCANCHPAIFVPQKGANQISMASILLGQQCGVCHGKVAFPVSECRLCHSKKKDLTPKAAAAAASGAGTK